MTQPNLSARTHDAQRLDAAGDWLQRLHSAPQDEDLLAEWLHWCADPANLDAFEKVRAVWQAIESPELRPVVARARKSFATAAPPRASRRRWAWSGALAASLALCGALAAWQLLRQADQPAASFLTAAAENKTELLPDGSRIDLGARSRVEIHFTAARRAVTIAAGEAYFTVAHDTARPFVVTAGAVRVTAVGTQFNVRRAQGDTVVTVSEGRVNVESDDAPKPGAAGNPLALAQVSAGQQVRYSAPARSLTVAHVDPALASSWRQGVLKFMDEPLGSVVAYVNRYSARQIIIDPSLAQRSYTGTVYGDHIDEWLLGLQRIYPLRVIGQGAESVSLVPIAPQPPAASAKAP